MNTLVEIRWHGRGGQGTVTAVKLLAEAALKGGKYIQAFPEYGPERTGAPLRAYNRIGTAPILLHTVVVSPDIIVIVDPSLIGMADLLEGIKEKTMFVINTSLSGEAMRELAGIQIENLLFTIDATHIALETLGRPIPNTPMLGALIKVSEILKLEDAEKEIIVGLGKKFSQAVVEANLKALRRGYKEVRGE